MYSQYATVFQISSIDKRKNFRVHWNSIFDTKSQIFDN